MSRFYTEALEQVASMQRRAIMALLLTILLLLATLVWVAWKFGGIIEIQAERHAAHIERLMESQPSLGDLELTPEEYCFDCGQTPGEPIGANIPDDMVFSGPSDGGSWAEIRDDDVVIASCWTPDNREVAEANARAAAVTGGLPMVPKEGEWCDAAPSLLPSLD